MTQRREMRRNDGMARGEIYKVARGGIEASYR